MFPKVIPQLLMRILLKQQVSGATERLLREDDRGRIWEHTESGERIWLDPSQDSSSSAAIVIETRGLKNTVPAGTFDGVAEARIQQSPMQRRTLRFAPV